jgi:hypothetical protein
MSTLFPDTRPQAERVQIELLRRWAIELGVADLLERALAEAEQTGEGR